MIIVDVHTTGITGIGEELIRDARAVAKSALSKASTPLARRYRAKLSRRGGPSAPGDPPARVTGALWSTVGKSAPKVDRDGDVVVHVGIGEGGAKGRRDAELKGEGINVFEYAALMEHGGITEPPPRRRRATTRRRSTLSTTTRRRYPPRPFARPAEEEAEGEISAILERELG